jgi:hypothetical protein
MAGPVPISIMLTMNAAKTHSKWHLVADRRLAEPASGSQPVRRFRLARVQANPPQEAAGAPPAAHA